jgi:hypothetical protein
MESKVSKPILTHLKSSPNQTSPNEPLKTGIVKALNSFREKGIKLYSFILPSGVKVRVTIQLAKLLKKVVDERFNIQTFYCVCSKPEKQITFHSTTSHLDLPNTFGKPSSTIITSLSCK